MHAYFTKKILHNKSFYCNLKKRKMVEARKERAIWYLKFRIEMCGVQKNRPMAFVLHCYIFTVWVRKKMSMQNVRKEMANIASIKRSSKQKQMVVFYKRLTALSSSNRRRRTFNTMYHAAPDSNCCRSFHFEVAIRFLRSSEFSS